ncbi:MAG: RND family transporter [Thiohalomonadales bacterium]
MLSSLNTLYYKITIERPLISILFVTIVIGFLSSFVGNFKLDASGDALILETDNDYRYFQSISAKYATDEFVVITYSPHEELFSETSIKNIQALRKDLLALPRVGEVTTYLDVPLISSPPVTFSEIIKQPRTLLSKDVDLALAKKEFTTSPIYENLLSSSDGKTTAIQIKFKRDKKYARLNLQRNKLREQRLSAELTPSEKIELKEISAEFKRHSSVLQEQQSQDIQSIRNILDRYRNNADIYLGGLPMIVADMISYIRHDIRVFGIGVISFIILLLAVSFKRVHWVIIPVSICLAAVIGMVGYLGMVDWKVTVVSSNFISLLLIITLSLTVHLIVRYQELHADKPASLQKDLIVESIRSKIVPSFYTVATTMVAFGSLLVSGIRPVIDFGWMMVFGVGLAFVLCFLIFPSILVFLKPGKPVQRSHDSTEAITGYLARTIKNHSNATIGIFVALMIFAFIGISNLTVENRFIDYFKADTEIYQGMLKIDEDLGGTTPLEVIIDADSAFIEQMKAESLASIEDSDAEDAEDDDDDFEDEGQDGGISGNSYWFNTFKLKQIAEIHNYLDNLPETGKVLSLASTMQILKTLNGGKEITNIILSVIYKRFPADLKADLFSPYMSTDGNQIRFSIRVFESDYNLRRQELINRIKTDLVNKFGLQPAQVKLTGMVVLYNNMLQSLFSSQILTIGVVFLAIMLMFLVLFKSLKISLIAILPSMVAAGLVLGMMGWLSIPLDIMTITIAAISIGIAVDNSIHYIHRFSEEFATDGDYWSAVARTHKSTGRAMYYTSMTITLGFSILALSSFIPTIYFGLFTGLAMMVALLANLTLLPALLVKTKALA